MYSIKFSKKEKIININKSMDNKWEKKKRRRVICFSKLEQIPGCPLNTEDHPVGTGVAGRSALMAGPCSPLVMVAEEADVHLVVLLLQHFGGPEAKAFHFSPNEFMIRYLEIKCFTMSRYF